MGTTSSTPEHSVCDHSPSVRRLKADPNIRYTTPDFELPRREWSDREKLDLDAFPSAYLLAVFANCAYNIGGPERRDVDIEVQLRLPNGWKMLTRAFNSKNDYQGAAFFCESQGQVVVAHAGTSLTKTGTLKADWKAVIHNEYHGHTDSAVTFANRIFQAAKASGYRLSFTGHSLGGWLAQVTTFTVELLVCQGPAFSRRRDGRWRVHTVVFDSPGCEKFLAKLQKDYCLRCVKTDTHYTGLDITIYLSAPNMINTWDYHVGSVYRIILETSHMGFVDRNVSYSLAMHKMERILKAFDEKTGLPSNVREVQDWLTRESFLRHGDEYKRFFTEGKHFNKYHSEVDCECIRYKTEQYDFSRLNVRIFSDAELAFLETVVKLRKERIKSAQLEELKNLFQIDPEEELFPSFRLDAVSGTVSCDTAEMLNQLVKRVKNLVRFYPEKINDSLKQQKMAYYLCELESQRYLNSLQTNNLQFKDEAGLCDFLSSPDRVLLIISVDAIHDSAVFTKLCKETVSKNTLFIGWEQIVQLSQQIDILAVMKRYNLLFIECAVSMAAEDEFMFRSIIKGYPGKVVFLVSSEFSEKINTFFQNFTENVLLLLHRNLKLDLSSAITVKRYDNFDYMCLKPHSLEMLKNETVKPPKQLCQHYLKRNLICHHEIRKDIWRAFLSEDNSGNLFIFTNVDKKEDLVQILKVPKEKRGEVLSCDTFALSSDVEAKRKLTESSICVHWIKVEGDRLVWNGSRGSVRALQNYIKADSSQAITEDDIENYPSKVIIIADEAGMGKTTTLNSLASKMKNSWVITLTLQNVQDLFLNLPKNLNVKDIAEFLLNAYTTNRIEDTVKTKIILNMLADSLEKGTPKEVVILLDGFDEIKDNSIEGLVYQKVISFINFLNLKSKARVVVTTRKHLAAELENALSVFSLSFEKISTQQQKDYFETVWLDRLANVDRKQLREYINKLFERAQTVFNQDIVTFIGVPLHMNMLAEVMEPDERLNNIPAGVYLEKRMGVKNLFDLYRKYLITKLNIYYRKHDITLTNTARRWLSEKITSLHQILGFQQVFPESTVFLGRKAIILENDEEELNRAGLVQYNNNSELEFTHYTFAEFHCADLLMKWLQKDQSERSPKYATLEEFFLTQVLLNSSYKMVRFFMDNSLKTTSVYLNYKNVVKDLWRTERNRLFTKYGRSAFHQTVQEETEELAKLLCNKDALKEECVVEYLTTDDRKGETALFQAFNKNNVPWLRVLFDALETCNEEIREKFLLKTFSYSPHKMTENLRTILSDSMQQTFESVAKKLEVVKTLFHLLQKGTLPDIKKHLQQYDPATKSQLLNIPFGKSRDTPLHFACQKGEASIVKYLLEEKCAYNVKNVDGSLPIHVAAEHGHLPIVKDFHELGVDLNIQNAYYVSVTAHAARSGHVHVLEYLYHNGANLDRTDRNAISPFMHAAKQGHTEAVRFLIDKVPDLDKTDKFGMCALSYAVQGRFLKHANKFGSSGPAKGRHLEIVRLLVEKGVNVNCKDRFSRTPLQLAIRATQWDIVEFLLEMEGVDLNVANLNCSTALDEADRVGKTKLIERLVEKGAKRYRELL